MSEAAAELARRRWAKAERVSKVCPHCGCAFPGIEAQVYCTLSHRNAAAAKRYRERRRADPLAQLQDETERQRRNDIRDGRDYL